MCFSPCTVSPANASVLLISKETWSLRVLLIFICNLDFLVLILDIDVDLVLGISGGLIFYISICFYWLPFHFLSPWYGSGFLLDQSKWTSVSVKICLSSCWIHPKKLADHWYSPNSLLCSVCYACLLWALLKQILVCLQSSMLLAFHSLFYYYSNSEVNFYFFF